MTEYVVLTRAGKPEADELVQRFWVEYARKHAHSAEQAIREAVDGSQEEHFGFAEFVAVPARNWKPISVGVEQVRRVVVNAKTEGSE